MFSSNLSRRKTAIWKKLLWTYFSLRLSVNPLVSKMRTKLFYFTSNPNHRAFQPIQRELGKILIYILFFLHTCQCAYKIFTCAYTHVQISTVYTWAYGLCACAAVHTYTHLSGILHVSNNSYAVWLFSLLVKRKLFLTYLKLYLGCRYNTKRKKKKKKYY